MTVFMVTPAFAQQMPQHENPGLSERVEEFEAKELKESKEIKEFKDSKESGELLRSQPSPLTKVNDAYLGSSGSTVSSCAGCAPASREAMTPEEKRQLRRDIHEAGRKIYTRHPRNPSRQP